MVLFSTISWMRDGNAVSPPRALGKTTTEICTIYQDYPTQLGARVTGNVRPSDEAKGLSPIFVCSLDNARVIEGRNDDLAPGPHGFEEIHYAGGLRIARIRWGADAPMMRENSEKVKTLLRK